MPKSKTTKKSYPAKKKGGSPVTQPKVKSEPTTPAVAQEAPSDNLGNTRRWARMCHGKQTDKAGQPYVTHLDAVARNLYYLIGFDLELLQAAYMHDLVEDTSVDEARLIAEGYSQRTIDTVLSVTKLKNEPNYDYISFVIESGPDAMLVKLADIYHNTRGDRLAAQPVATRERLLKKYYPAMWRLEQALIAQGYKIDPKMTFEKALEAAKPKPTTYAPKWRESTSPSTVMAGDLMVFPEEGVKEITPEMEKFSLRVKSKSTKGVETTFTFHDTTTKVTFKSGDRHWVKWGGGASGTTTTGSTKSSSTWTPEWVKLLGLPDGWVEGDDLPEPGSTFKYKAWSSTTTSYYPPKGKDTTTDTPTKEIVLASKGVSLTDLAEQDPDYVDSLKRKSAKDSAAVFTGGSEDITLGDLVRTNDEPSGFEHFTEVQTRSFEDMLADLDRDGWAD